MPEWRADRGMSELLSFVLVFALVISTVALVYALGYPALLHVQDAERLTNAERSMTTLADVATDLTVRGAPSRATEVKLSEASLSFADPVTVTVTDAGGDLVAKTAVRPLVYDAPGGTRVVYAAGGVFREQPDALVVVRDPDLVVSGGGAGDRTVILVPATRPATSTDAVAGQTDVLVRLERANATTVTTTGDLTVTVDADDPRQVAAWAAYFQSRGASACTPVDADSVTVSCTLPAGRSTVTVVDVAVELE